MSLLQALNLRPLPRGPATPVSIAILKPGPFEPGGQQQLAAVMMFSDGSTRDITAKVTWRSSDEALVKVLPGGLAKVGSGAGPVTITATGPGGKPRDSIDVTVRAALQDIVVTPANPLVEAGESETLTATAVYADGSTDNITGSVEWESSRPDVADFTPGLGSVCVAKAAGTATVSATHVAGKLTGSTRLTVAAKGRVPLLTDIEIGPINPDVKGGEPVPFHATGIFADKSKHDITTKVTWESSKPDLLTIDPVTGVARGRPGAGSALIRALDTTTNLHRSTTAYVDIPGIVRISVAPKVMSVARGKVAPFTVTATLQGGGAMNANDITQWNSADRLVADVVAGGGQVLGSSMGRTVIEVFYPGSDMADTIDVTVLPPVLASIVVLPPIDPIHVGQTVKFTASGFLSDLTPRPLIQPRWSSSKPAVLEVDQTGAVTVKAAGDAVIRVEDRDTGIVGTVAVAVTP